MDRLTLMPLLDHLRPSCTRQDVAPKYSGETVTVETQDQMYPGHKNFATMAGVSSVLSTINGSHAGWIEAVNEDMVARGIELTHEINGVKTGKHSSADWKEYSALFDPETGLDSNGVPMPGTAGAPVEEVAVKPEWYIGAFQKFLEPYNSQMAAWRLS